METVTEPKDIWHRFMKWVDHNRYQAAGIVVTCAILLMAYGCQSKTTSIFEPDKKVTRTQLNAEADIAQQEIEVVWAALEAKAKTYTLGLDAGHKDLDRQDEMSAQLQAYLGGLATSAVEGTINPLQAVTSGISLAALLVGGGTFMDNRRKDKIILERPTA